MAGGVQMKEQLGWHHWSGRNDILHLLERCHGKVNLAVCEEDASPDAQMALVPRLG